MTYEQFVFMARSKGKCAKNQVSNNHLRRMFQSIDADKNGFLSLEELSSWSENIPIQAPASLIKAQAMAQKAKEDRLVFQSIRNVLGSGHVQDFFHKFSKDSSDALEYEDFVQMIRLVVNEVTLPDIVISRLFAIVDLNNDAVIELGEFRKWLESGSPRTPASFSEKEAIHVNQAEYKVRQALKLARFHLIKGFSNWSQLFNEFDGDGSGLLDESEFIRAVRKSGLSEAQLSTDQLHLVFESIDDDGSGLVDLDECSRWMTAAPAGPSLLRVPQEEIDAQPDSEQEKREIEQSKTIPDTLEKLKRKFKAAAYSGKELDLAKLHRDLDRNNTGWICRDEFLRAVRKTCQLTESKFSTKLVNRVFDLIDSDASGSIELSEFDNFVGGAREETAADQALKSRLATKSILQQQQTKEKFDLQHTES